MKTLKGFKRGYGLIETLTAISILGIALTPIFHYELLRFEKNNNDSYKENVKKLISQQETIKKIQGYYYEFSFMTSASNKKYVVDGYEFMMYQPNTSVNFDVYYETAHDGSEYECLALEVNSNKYKSLWDSCSKQTIEHVEL